MHEQDPGLRGEEPVDQDLLSSFLDDLSKKLRVTSLVVFGSRARGENLNDSDYDLLVLSPDFEDLSRPDRIFLLLETWEALKPLEPVAMTPEEFMQAEGALVWDILDCGLVIRDEGVFEDKRRQFLKRLACGELKKEEGFWSFA